MSSAHQASSLGSCPSLGDIVEVQALGTSLLFLHSGPSPPSPILKSCGSAGPVRSATSWIDFWDLEMATLSGLCQHCSLIHCRRHVCSLTSPVRTNPLVHWPYHSLLLRLSDLCQGPLLASKFQEETGPWHPKAGACSLFAQRRPMSNELCKEQQPTS